jgi:hypothetical protein
MPLPRVCLTACRMEAREFLDFGLKINEDDEFRLDFLKPLLEKQLETPAREALMRAFKRRKSRRIHYVAVEHSEHLLALCKKWNAIGSGVGASVKRREVYEEFLCGEAEWDEVKAAGGKIEPFDAEMRVIAGETAPGGETDPIRVLRVLLLVQDLTRQLCEKDSLGQKRPQRDWRLTATLITHWDLD